MPPVAATPSAQYRDGETVLVYAKDFDRYTYQAVIKKAVFDKKSQVWCYTIHYKGWNSSSDEELSGETAKKRILRFDATIAAEHKKLYEADIAESKKKKKRSLTKLETPQRRKSVATGRKKATAIRRGRDDQDEEQASENKENDPMEVDDSVEEEDDREGAFLLTAKIHSILQYDRQAVYEKKKSLPRLPAYNTITDIVNQFNEELKTMPLPDNVPFTKKSLNRFTSNINDYMDNYGGNLYYESEKEQFRMHDIGKKKRPSESYGFVHLMRMFTAIREVKPDGTPVQDAIASTVKFFLEWVQSNAHKFYDRQTYYINVNEWRQDAEGIIPDMDDETED